MKTVRFYEHGGPEVLKVEDVNAPRPRPGEILIEVEVIGLNFTDVSARKGGTLRSPLTFPYTPGVEVAGRVRELTEGSTRFRVGDRVVALVPQGGYSELVAVPEALTIKIPDTIETELAAAIPLQGLTAYHILKTLGRLQAGETVLVQAAAGGVGSFAVQLAKILGARVVAATGSDEKIARALSLGADAGVRYDRPGWIEAVRNATGGVGADLLLDMVGGPMFSEDFAALSPLGRVVTYGAASGQRAVIDPEALTSRCHSVSGFYSGFAGRQSTWVGPPLKELFDLVADGVIKVDVNHRFPLVEAAEAHRQFEARRTTGKVVLIV
jgi:NADPH2:quinone reductase